MDLIPTCTLLSVSFIISLVPLTVDFHSSSENPSKEGVCEIVLYPLEWMPFGNQHSDFPTFVDVFHDLMEGGGEMELR